MIEPFQLLERRFEESQRISQTGSFEWDLKTDGIWWSPETYRLYELPIDSVQLNFAQFLSYVRHDHRERVRGLVEASVQSGERYEARFPFYTAQGNERWMHAVGELVFDGNGRPTRLVGTARDITEWQRKEEQLRHSHQLEALGGLAAGVAHDLNNLLTVIRGFSELLEPSNETDREYVRTISETVLNAGHLSTKLLSLGRQQALTPRLVDVASVVHGIQHIIRRVTRPNTSIEIHATSTPTIVNIDPIQIEQLAFNVIANSEDAMPEGGTLSIYIEHVLRAPFHTEKSPASGWAVLRFVDDGAGMDPEIQRHAFDPFFTTKAAGHGTGLGLASVETIAREHGGEVLLKSELGRGCEVAVFLPCVQGKPEATSDAPTPPPTDLEGTVLVVDGDASLRTTIRLLLERRGLQVRTAETSDDAIKVLNEDQVPDLVLTEILLPGSKPAELAQRIRTSYPAIPLVLTSGYSPDIASTALLADAGRVLRKPFTEAQLIEEIGQRMLS